MVGFMAVALNCSKLDSQSLVPYTENCDYFPCTGNVVRRMPSNDTNLVHQRFQMSLDAIHRMPNLG